MTRPWRQTSVLLALGVLLFGIAFSHEATAAIHVWLVSTAYNHCWLILPIAAYLAWERRAGLAHLTPSAEPRAALLATPFALGWLLANRLGIMEGRQLAAMALLQCLILGVIGRKAYWYFRAPLWYLFFLVPFGGFLVAPLQHFTAVFAADGLSLLGIAHYLHGTTIEISAGAFRIAQACAGLRFLIAAIAFAVLYALVIFRSTGRRLIFIAVCLVVPVIANGFRALGIIWLGYAEGSAKAAATDHVLYGYIFFSIVLLIIILLGLPFREDHAPPQLPPDTESPDPESMVASHPTSAPTQPPSQPKARITAALAVLAISLAAPITAAAFDRIARATKVNPPTQLADCRLSASPTTRLPSGAVRRDFTCANAMRVTIVAFPPATTPEPIFDLRRTLGLINLREAHLGLISPAGRTTPHWQLAVSKHGHHRAASDLLINGHLTLGSLLTRLHMVASRPSPPAAQLVIILTPKPGQSASRTAISQALASPALSHASLRQFAQAALRSPQ
jgi:exosortase A